MSTKPRVLALLPARYASKRLPAKPCFSKSNFVKTDLKFENKKKQHVVEFI